MPFYGAQTSPKVHNFKKTDNFENISSPTPPLRKFRFTASKKPPPFGDGFLSKT